MNRSSTRSKQQANLINWVQYVSTVLAFIGLWQLLSSGTTFIHQLF